MSYYFQKCCFDSEKIGVRNECDRLTRISNGKHNFGLFFHRNNDETFYCLNKKKLEEYWQCVIAERHKHFVLINVVFVKFVKSLIKFLIV